MSPRPASSRRTRPTRATRRPFHKALAEQLESRLLLSVALDPFPPAFGTNTFIFPAGKSIVIPLTATSTSGALTYTVTSTSNNVIPLVNSINPAVSPTRTYVRFSTSLGNMDFQLFNDVAPLTVSHLLNNLSSPDYINSIFHRIIKGFVVQGGDRNGDGIDNNVGLAIETELDSRVLYTGTGQLAEARTSQPDSGGSQFFITSGTQRSLDLNYSIFGQMLRGWSVLSTMNNLPTDANDRPLNPPTLLGVSVISDVSDAVVTLVSTSGTPINGAITVTAKAADGTQDVKIFNFSTVTDTVNDPPFLPPPSQINRAVLKNVQTVITIGAPTDLEGDASTVSGKFLTNPSNFTASFNADRTAIAITPDSGYTGQLQLELDVTQTSNSALTSGRVYTFFVDSGAAPSAALHARDLFGSGAAFYTFTVTYTDDAFVDTSTILNNSTLISVNGPGGYNTNATFLSIDSGANGPSRVVTYRIPAPGGTWDAADAGGYAIKIKGGVLKDTLGNTSSGATLGAFYFSPTAFFDERYYLTANPDVAAAVNSGAISSGYLHFILYGQTEHRPATPYFNETLYLALNPDIAAAVNAHAIKSGWQHFVSFGAHEGRLASPIFSESQYLMLNPDIAAAKNSGVINSGFEHFILYGQFEGRSPSLYFNLAQYASLNPDVVAAVNAGTAGLARTITEHFLLAGQREGRHSNDFFDESYYLSHNPDVAAAVTAGTFRSGFEHYIFFGAVEKRPASPLFDSNFYLAHNPDVAAAVAAGSFRSAYDHWLLSGHAEGRLGVGIPPSLSIVIRYAGSTTNTLSGGQILSGSGQTANPNLTNQVAAGTSTAINLNDAAEISSFRHYFDVGFVFNKGTSDTALRIAIFNLALTGTQASFIAPDDTTGGTTQKFFPFNLNNDNTGTTTFTISGDAGTQGDLQNITYIDPNSATAYDAQVGVGGGGTINGLPVTSPTWVGRFAVQTNGPLTNEQIISVAPINGSSFSYYDSRSGTTVTTASGITGSSFTISFGAP